jgi:hypothetical protein
VNHEEYSNAYNERSNNGEHRQYPPSFFNVSFFNVYRALRLANLAESLVVTLFLPIMLIAHYGSELKSG